jgi:hypothetical protein
MCLFNYLFVKENIFNVFYMFLNYIKVQKIKYIKFSYRGFQIGLYPQCD